MLLLFFLSCVTKTHIAPIESNILPTAKKIIVKLKDGTELKLRNVNVEMELEKIVGYTKDKERKELSFELIREVMLVKEDYTFAYLYGGVALVGAWLLIGAETAPEPPPSESCPFIYSFDGEKYIFDAEPYGGAICQRLKRTELCRLEHLKEINGQYKILSTNELNETQYIDELKLVIVDHHKEAQVAPDISGKIHTVSRPTVPFRASDSKGRDIMPCISNNDEIFWQTQVEEKNPERKQDLRDELILAFPKPEAAKKAKLLINACNTLWGSHALKKYLDLYGNTVHKWYDEINSPGPAFFRMVNLHVGEQLYSLQIKVKSENGWKSKGIILGGGPFVSEDKIYPIDISDVPGDTLIVRLTPPAPFWTINYIAVDYKQDLPIKVTEVTAQKAITNKNEDVREIIAKNDNNYLVMPDIGDRTELIFKSPSQMDGMARSIFLKASGYYDIHLQAEGEPNYEILERIQSEPGFVVQYAFKQYLSWREVMAR